MRAFVDVIGELAVAFGVAGCFVWLVHTMLVAADDARCDRVRPDR